LFFPNIPTSETHGHVPVPSSKLAQPDFVSTPFPDADDDELIDVVVMDFAMEDFLIATSILDPERNLSAEDFEPYAEGTTIRTIFGDYAKKHWRTNWVDHAKSVFRLIFTRWPVPT